MFMRHQAPLKLDTIRPNKEEDDTIEEEKCLKRELSNDSDKVHEIFIQLENGAPETHLKLLQGGI